MIKDFLNTHSGTIKWICTGFMLAGSLVTGLKLHPYAGFVLLVLGNAFWSTILLKMREWAAAAVFVIMGMSWFIGFVNHYMHFIK